MEKWVYRLESTTDNKGLWYDADGNYIFLIGELDNCPSRDIPMGYDERYRQGGKSWFSSCSDVAHLTHWFSIDNAKELIDRGFQFYKYLARDYVEYEKETVFLKETVKKRVPLSLEEVFNLKESN